jgi:DNA polymerase-3 subunit beta
LTATAYDLEIAYNGTIPAEVTKDGQVAVNANALASIVKALPGDRVSLSVEKNRLVVSSAEAEFRLATLPAEEFPALPVVEAGISAKVDGLAFVKALDAVAYASSNDETRYALCSVFLEAKDGKIKTTATDGHRLTHYEMEWLGGSEIPGIIIAKKTVPVLRKMLTDGEWAVSVTESTISVKCATENVTARLIDGSFPDYESVIPERGAVTTLERKTLLSILNRMKLISDSTKWSLSATGITFSALDPDLGEVSESLVGSLAPATFGMNAGYVRETLNAWPDELVHAFLPTDSTTPVVFESPSGHGYAVVMPMRY